MSTKLKLGRQNLVVSRGDPFKYVEIYIRDFWGLYWIFSELNQEN